MRRYVIASLVVLGLHVVAAFLVWPYSDVIMAVGRHMGVRGHDIADIPDLLFAGLLAVGALLVCITIGVVYLMDLGARRSSEHSGG